MKSHELTSHPVNACLRRMLVFVPVFLLLVISGVGVASANTINFGSLSQPGTGFVSMGTSVSQGGFTFTSTGGPFGDQLGVWQNGSANHPIGGISTCTEKKISRTRRSIVACVTNRTDQVRRSYCACKSVSRRGTTGSGTS